MSFPYFANPLAYAYLADAGKVCNFCGTAKNCLDAETFFGEEQIEAVCFECMSRGCLIDLDISTNNIKESELDGSLGDTNEISNDIVYRTPLLPTWQEHFWPIRNGKPCRFIKIASKHDYDSQDEFVTSLQGCDETDTEWLWSVLPDHEISNLADGQYSVSLYLFDGDGEKVTILDAN